MTVNVEVGRYTIEVGAGQPIPGPPGPPGPVYTFPPGQPGQVWTVLPSGQMGWTTPAPAAPTPPIAGFSMSASTVQVGGSVTFTDASTNGPTSWTWTIVGVPPVRTGQGPHVVAFPTVGTFTVTLQIANAAGTNSSSQQITVTAAPVVHTPGEVVFTTTGSTFSPRIELVTNATQTVSWVDGDDVPLSPATGLQPTFNFGTAATRTVKMQIPDGSEVRVVNIGYNYGDDIGQYSVPNSYNHPAQQVTAISGLPSLPNLVYFLAANGPLAGHLDFTGCSQLTFVECFNAFVRSVNLTGCSSMIRLCFETNNFDPTVAVDLNPVAATLRDIRWAAQKSGGIRWANLNADIPNLYHWCVRDQVIHNAPSPARFTGIVEYWAWGTTNANNQAGGAFSVVSDLAYDIRATGVNSGWTSFTDAERSVTGPPRSEGSLDLAYAGFTSVTLHPTSVWRSLSFVNNPGLTTANVDHILTTVNSWNTSNGTLNLTGCGQPSSAAPAIISALRGRGWTVNTETPLSGAPPAPTANFSVVPTSPQATVPATFTSTSTYAETWAWNFGNGATPATANTVGPHSVTYSNTGVKAVALTVTNATGSDSETQNVTVQAAPSGGDLFVDYFNRTAADIAALGGGWNAAGTGVTASANGTDLLYVANGFFGRLATTTSVVLPADYGIEVIAPRNTWDRNFCGIFLRYLAASDNTGVKLFTVDGTTWVIGDTRSWDFSNAAFTSVNGFPAGWTSAGDHSVRLQVVGTRVDIYADGQHVGYRDAMGSWCNAGATGTGVGFCGDSFGGQRAWGSIRVYPLA